MSLMALGNIKPGDILDLSIKGVPPSEKAMVDGRYVVGSNGQIKIPIADQMLVARGLSHDQLARKVEQVYKKSGIYMRPTITIVSNLEREPENVVVSVGGRVKRSGPIPFRRGITLQQAIQAAGDIDAFGSKKRIFLTRAGKRHVISLKTTKGRNFTLQPGDTIVVDQKKAFE